MSTNRAAAIALIAGSLAGLVTMALHPTGREVIDNASAGATNALVTGVHALALLAQPLLLVGTLVLTLRLRARREIAVLAYVCYAFATAAVLIAAAASGFLAPSALRDLADADESSRAAMMNALHYTGLVNQTFAQIHVMFAGVALLLWSVAMLWGRELSRSLGIYGVVLSIVLLLAIMSGQMRLDIHGFGLVAVGESVWMIWAAIHLVLWDSSTLESAITP